ncbi:MAG: cupin domain-containing protein [Ignavibacteria bacterium]|jgi:mannose-6-phosphate isomerase-like protein (cupin superfamily)|nr:cupin domain-containing protein [Ignavibacteria bacterium]
MEVINLNEKLKKIPDHFNPKIIAELNGQYVKVAKFQGEFVWHSHKNEDEMFLVIKGKFHMDFRDKTVLLGEGDIIVVPKETEHRPRADEEVHVLLFEPAGTVNTGDVENPYTRKSIEWV